MSSLLQSSEQAPNTVVSSNPPTTTSDLFLRNRLKIIEDVWESVLCQECGQQLVDLLHQLASMTSPEGQAEEFQGSDSLKLIEQLDINQAIRAARGFALYFQLINIVEQHYEQREQQLAYNHGKGKAKSPVSPVKSMSTFDTRNQRFSDQEESPLPNVTNYSEQDRELATFHSLFPMLRQLNVPAQKIQRLLDQLDVRMVFTAHPTEIVRHTIRTKQRRIATILEQLDQIDESFGGLRTEELGEIGRAHV